jgi:hypothetical protein
MECPAGIYNIIMTVAYSLDSSMKFLSDVVRVLGGLVYRILLSLLSGTNEYRK